MKRSLKQSMKSRWVIENTPLKGLLLTALVVLALVPVAHAGIVDTPVPNLAGTSPNKTKTRFSVAGVMNSGSLGTYFACTSTSSSTQQVSVEVFTTTGGIPLNNAVANQVTANPGASVIFGTGTAAGLTLNASLGAPGMANGSARILSTSTVICTAFWADKVNDPASLLAGLTIVKTHTQKGD